MCPRGRCRTERRWSTQRPFVPAGDLCLLNPGRPPTNRSPTTVHSSGAPQSHPDVASGTTSSTPTTGPEQRRHS